MSAGEHKQRAPKSVRVYFVTVSDTRTLETDTSGQRARQMIEAAGHSLVGYRIVKDEPAEVAQLVRDIVEGRHVDLVITSGGTGISLRDSTYEAIDSLLDKRLDGFGELFRMLSYADIGAAAMMSRAVGGIHRGVAVFALPGSQKAVELGLEKLILPETGHLVFEAHR